MSRTPSPALSSIDYLKQFGFDYKSAATPLIWTHLENQVSESNRIGAKFNSIPSSAIAGMIEAGEAALLAALESQHRRTGKLDQVSQVIDMPFVVGTVGVIPQEGVDEDKLLRLIERPGTAQERVIHVLPVESDALPITRQVTVTGGTYADGHSVGVFGMMPGDGGQERRFGGRMAYLATPSELRHLARDMENKADDIVAVTRQECDAMLAKVRELLR